MTTRVLLILFLACLGINSAEAQQEFFPFLGEVAASKVNVRAGVSTNYERLCQLNEGDELIVLANEYGWQKVQLPSHCLSYISEEFVQLLSDSSGGVIADRVNIRARPSTTSSVIGRLDAGVEVSVVNLENGFYRIKPHNSFAGFISENFVAFKSSEISDYSERPVKDKKKESDKVVKKEIEIKKMPAPKPKMTTVKVKGLLTKLNRTNTNDLLYRIQTDDGADFRIEGYKHLMEPYIGAKVSVEGIKRNPNSSTPIITATKIELLL